MTASPPRKGGRGVHTHGHVKSGGRWWVPPWGQVQLLGVRSPRTATYHPLSEHFMFFPLVQDCSVAIRRGRRAAPHLVGAETERRGGLRGESLLGDPGFGRGSMEKPLRMTSRRLLLALGLLVPSSLAFLVPGASRGPATRVPRFSSQVSNFVSGLHLALLQLRNIPVRGGADEPEEDHILSGTDDARVPDCVI